jgi:hypothetical protein
MIERGLVVCDGTYAVAYLAHWQDSQVESQITESQ